MTRSRRRRAGRPSGACDTASAVANHPIPANHSIGEIARCLTNRRSRGARRRSGLARRARWSACLASRTCDARARTAHHVSTARCTVWNRSTAVYTTGGSSGAGDGARVAGIWGFTARTGRAGLASSAIADFASATTGAVRDVAGLHAQCLACIARECSGAAWVGNGARLSNLAGDAHALSANLVAPARRSIRNRRLLISADGRT